ncbi:MAG: cell surface protein [Acidobacteriia bacterium]|nr:cell surface protein [Terriglobia bacterium]
MRIQPRTFRLYAPLALFLCAPGGSAPVTEESQNLSPLALVADPQGKLLYIAEFTASQIAVFEIAAERVRQTIPLPDRPSGMALSADGNRLYVTGGVAAGKVYVVDTRRGAIVETLAAGHMPNAPVLSRDGNTLFVCNRFNNNVSVHDLKSKAVTVRIAVGREPVAAKLSADGRRLFVANQLPAGPANSGDVAAAVSVIDTAALRSEEEIRLPDGSTGLRDLSLSPDGRFLYVTHILSRYQLPASQIERGWIQTNALTVIDAGSGKRANSVLLDDINLGAANPWGIACTGDGKLLLVAHAGTHEVSVIDRQALHRKLEETGRGEKVSDVSVSAGEVVNDLAFLTGLRRRVPLKGNGPRGLAVIGSSVYTAEYFTGSLGVVELAAGGNPESRSVKLGEDMPLTAARRGEMLFHDAQYCLEKWLSCSSCHPSEGRPDGLNWDLMLDGVGNAKNTKSLLFSHRTPPTTVTGTRPNAEVSVRAGFRYIQFAQRPEEDAASVDAYLKSLRPAPSPYLEDGELSAAAGRGKRVFEKAGCGSCHSGPFYTDMRKHNAGTGRGQEEGIAFDVPTLLEIWRTAPYLHDGRAPTLKHLFTAPGSGRVHVLTTRVNESDIDDLVAFVSSL